jgi:hypothetical protein
LWIICEIQKCKHLPGNVTDSLDWDAIASRTLLRAAEAVGEVVGGAGLVVGVAGGTVALVVGHSGAVGAVHRDLQVVGAKTVAVSVGVREQTPLQHLVRAGFNAGHQVGGAEGDLLHFGKVVLGVAVQHQLADRDQWEFSMGPNLCTEEIIKLG